MQRISKLEPKSLLLAEFHQVQEIKKCKMQTQGVCSGNTDLWLCLHKFSPPKSLAELISNEKWIMHQIKHHMGEVLLMQKSFDIKEQRSLSELGLVEFSQQGKDAIFKPGPYCHIISNASQTIEQRAAEFVSAIRLLVGGGSAHAPEFINFSYFWQDDDGTTEKDEVNKVSEVNSKRKGHSIGIIKNLCPGCEVVIFDSNTGSRVFAKKEYLYEKLEYYFKKVLQRNGIPSSWSSSYAVEVDLKLRASPLATTGLFKNKKDVVIEVESEPLVAIKVVPESEITFTL